MYCNPRGMDLFKVSAGSERRSIPRHRVVDYLPLYVVVGTGTVHQEQAGTAWEPSGIENRRPYRVIMQ